MENFIKLHIDGEIIYLNTRYMASLRTNYDGDIVITTVEDGYKEYTVDESLYEIIKLIMGGNEISPIYEDFENVSTTMDYNSSSMNIL